MVPGSTTPGGYNGVNKTIVDVGFVTWEESKSVCEVGSSLKFSNGHWKGDASYKEWCEK